MDDEEWWPPEAFARIGATGYFGITAPPSLGGAGMDLFTSGSCCRPSRGGTTRSR
jgi:isovaleryl-CoA dehydrogenase